jgi:hypothetical protein
VIAVEQPCDLMKRIAFAPTLPHQRLLAFDGERLLTSDESPLGEATRTSESSCEPASKALWAAAQTSTAVFAEDAFCSSFCFGVSRHTSAPATGNRGRRLDGSFFSQSICNKGHHQI